MQRKLGTILSIVCGLALLVALLLALGSATGQTRAAAPTSPRQIEAHSRQSAASDGACPRPLVVGLDYEPSLDYFVGWDLNSITVIDQIMEGLYRYQPDGDIEPAGATTYAVSADGLVYTVTLRSDARWSDGQTVTAQHYVDGIIRRLDPDTGGGLAFMLYTIEGAEDFNNKVITDANQVGVKALGTFELQFTLQDPAAFFPSLMATAATYPGRLDIINSDPDWTEAGHFVGNGPYELTEWVHYVNLAVEKNPYYHSPGQATITQVRFPIIAPADQLAAYEDDQLDVMQVPQEDLSNVLSDPVLNAEFQVTPRPGVYYLGLSAQVTATDNVTVRKALASAIDREYLLTDVLNMPWREAATSVIPPGIPGYQNGAVGYTFNVTQARDYLAAAGYPGGVGFPEIELWANNGNQTTVEQVAADWRNNLGITVTTFYTDFSPYLGLLDECRNDPGACAYNAYRLGWVMDYADAYNILNDLFHPDLQYTGWDNARYRQLIDMALTETNQLSRTLYFQEADQILVEEGAAIIPLYFYDRQSLVKSGIVFEYVPFGGPHFMNWEITPVATATIGVAGGSITSPDGDVTVEFPAGAVASTVQVTYTAVCTPSASGPDTFAFAGNVFELEVADGSGNPITTFAQPLTITIDYTDGDLNGQDESTLELMFWDGSGWSSDGVTAAKRDRVNNQLVVRVAHLTEFALFGQYPPTRPIAVGLVGEPNLDPHQAADQQSHAVGGQLMQGLFQYAPDGSVEPAGALTYTVSDDGLAYTVTLRTDARWSDGEAVIAQHYVSSVIRLLDPDTGSGWFGNLMYVLEGAEDFHDEVISDANQVGVAALGPFELRFDLRETTAYFPSLMATPATYPVRQDIIDLHGGLWTEPGNYVGNGPYALTAWVHDDYLVVEKNLHYYDADQVTIEKVTFYVLPDPADQLAAYENDLLDVSQAPGSELPRVLADPVLRGEFYRTPQPGVYYLGLNTQLAPTDIITVRKALASAIDRGYLLTDALNMPWREAATSAIPPGIPGYQNEEVGYTFNVTQARDYLASAGYPDGVGFPEIELWANNGNQTTVEQIVADWRNNLNITVTTFYTDIGPYLGLLGGCQGDPSTCDYNGYRLGWVMDYADANNILNDLFHPDAQYTGWDNARYRQLIGMALTETNQVSRTAYYQEADQILVEDEVAVIPIYFYDRQSLVKSDLLPEYIPFYWGPFYMNWRLTTATTNTVPSTGGTVSSPDGDVEVEFPEDAVSDTVIVTYTAFYEPPHPPTGTFSFAGNAFILEVTEIGSGDEITTFVEPLTITIDYTDGDLNGQDENALELMYWNGSEWSTDGIAIVEHDKVNNRLVITIDHVTEFALFSKYGVYLPLVLRDY